MILICRLSCFLQVIMFFLQVIITSSGEEKAELSQKILDVLYATEDGFAIPDESEIPEEF